MEDLLSCMTEDEPEKVDHKEQYEIPKHQKNYGHTKRIKP